MRERNSKSGDYQLLEIGEDNVVIARGEDGKVYAMHNICRHRGARVCGAVGQPEDLCHLPRLGL